MVQLGSIHRSWCGVRILPGGLRLYSIPSPARPGRVELEQGRCETVDQMTPHIWGTWPSAPLHMGVNCPLTPGETVVIL